MAEQLEIVAIDGNVLFQGEDYLPSNIRPDATLKNDCGDTRRVVYAHPRNTDGLRVILVNSDSTKQYTMKRHQMNCISYWLPRLEGLPTPKTVIVRTDCRLESLCDGQLPEGYSKFIEDLHAAIGAIGTLPVFMRTGHTSAKHFWDSTCFVQDLEQLPSHVCEIVMYSLMATPSLPVDVWAIREFLHIEHQFTAFKGMPAGREFRFFIRGGKITHLQPYWPPQSIQNASSPDWEHHLKGMSKVDGDDFQQAEVLALETAARFKASADGEWSVDVCKTVDRGWMITDMAVGEMSFKLSI